MSAVRLGYVILYVQDVSTAIAFYENAFGLTRRFVHESGQYAELETGQTALAFADEATTPTAGEIERVSSTRKAPAMEVALVVEDVGAVYTRALEAGAVAVSPPQNKPWGQVVAYVRDNSGFLVEVCSAVAGSS